jgi:hypothetical protein
LIAAGLGLSIAVAAVATGSPVALLAPGGGTPAGGSAKWLRGTMIDDGPEGARVWHLVKASSSRRSG